MFKADKIILVLLILIIWIYINKYINLENFSINFRPYYPISPSTKLEYNNFTDKIDDSRLSILYNVLRDVKLEANDGIDKYLDFNYANLPTSTSTMDDNKIKPITTFLLESINTKLPDGHGLNLLRLEEASKVEVETEVKVTFKMICDYKIKRALNYSYLRNIFNNEKNNNNLVIDVEVISVRKTEYEKLHLNTLNIIGLSSDNLPGSNYYENDNQFTFTESLSNKLIDSKESKNNAEVNNINTTILPEEEISMNDINTEEAESFFDL